MAITYTVLTSGKTTTGSIANWLNRGDLPTANILLEAEALIYEHLRVREMITDAAFTFDADASTEALPSGFLDPIQFLPYTYGDPLPFYHEEKMPFVRDSDGDLLEGTPSAWTIIGTTAYVDVTCSDDFSGRLMYYKQPDALSGSNETNFLTTRYPKLLRYACMTAGYEHMKDDARSKAYMDMMMGALQSAMASNEMWRRSQRVPA